MITHTVIDNSTLNRRIATMTITLDDCLKQAVNASAEHSRQVIDSTGNDGQIRLIISDADQSDMFRVMYKALMDSIILFKAYTTDMPSTVETFYVNGNTARISFLLPIRLKHIPTYGVDPLELPEQSFNESLLFQIDNAMDDYVVNSILTAWYKLKSIPDLYNLYSLSVQNNRDSIKNLLNERTKPVVLRHRNL